jgi:hypothetical protein
MSPLSGISARRKWALGATALVMLHLIAVAGIARSRPDHTKGPLARVSAGHQRPFQHVVAGEGVEPSKLSRWIYSPKAASL